MKAKMLKMFIYLLLLKLISITNAYANSEFMIRTNIPASSCQPTDSVLASRVQLVNGSWVFKQSQTGLVKFYCPVFFNFWGGVTLDLGEYFYNYPLLDMNIYAVRYRDTSGTNSNSFVTVRLTYRTVTGMKYVGGMFNSNDHPETINTEQNIVFKGHLIDTETNLYAFYVEMYRANTNEDPAFSGILFSTPYSPGP